MRKHASLHNLTRHPGGQSCDSCRKSKVRCDGGGSPCSRCVARGSLCIYSSRTQTSSKDSRQTTNDIEPAKTVAPTPTELGLTTVLDGVASGDAGPLPPQSEAIEMWLSRCTESYFGCFHERWPVLHAPVFNWRRASSQKISTVAIIGAWLRDGGLERDAIIRAHLSLSSQTLTWMVSNVSSMV